MNPLTEDDLAQAEAAIEEAAVSEALRADLFAVDEHGNPRMVDPEYARTFRTRLQSALDLKRERDGQALEGTAAEAPRVPTQEERAEWEKLYFATDPKTGRRMMSDDAAYRAKVNAMRDRIFGTTARKQNGNRHA